MAKPSTLFTWATNANDGSGNPTKVQPPAGKMATGWLTGEALPAQIFNWLLNHAQGWLTWVKDYAAGLEITNTFTGTNEFQGILKHSSSTAGAAINFIGRGLWFSLLGSGTLSSNPPTTRPVCNELLAKNTLKAWARVSVVSGTPTIVDGFNVASVAKIVGSDTHLRVNFASALADTNYLIIPGQCTQNAGVPCPQFAQPEFANRTQGYFDLGFMQYNHATDSWAMRDISTAGFGFEVLIFGVQANP